MSKTDKQKVIVVVGPTASGKTSLSIALAKRFNGEVISADSRQVYRGLDIGTEKVTPEEMGNVQHHLIDVADVSTVYSASDFVHDAERAIGNIVARGNVPIIAGGTFFYIDALLGAAPLPNTPPDPKLRAELEQLPTESLFAALQRLDPRRATTIDPYNKRRLVRALEIVKSLGHVPSQETISKRYDALLIGIAVEKDELRERIRARAAHALDRGLVAETATLLKQGVSRERLAEIGLEYPLVISYLDGDLSEAELVQKLEEKNWQYARRQLMWLKRMSDIHWVSSGDIAAASTHIEPFLDMTH